jgi:hypothetical protein
LKEAQTKQGIHEDAAFRLRLREEAFQRNSYKKYEARTLRQLTEERKKQMFEDNMGKFGKISIGVHGRELPKFSDEEGEDK